MFLFENYMEGNAAINLDEEALVVELERVGFERYEINRALTWLTGLIQFQKLVGETPSLTSHAIRHYSPDEAERLGVEGRGLLLSLEQMGILDPATREVALDRIMALDIREVDLGRIKWVILLVLFNQPDKKIALALMQDMVLADTYGILH